MSDNTTPTEKAALVEAARLCGGQAPLARKLSETIGKRVSQQWIWNVINRDQPIPAEWCLPVETVTECQVTRHQLRPDLYPHQITSAA